MKKWEELHSKTKELEHITGIVAQQMVELESDDSYVLQTMQTVDLISELLADVDELSGDIKKILAEEEV